MTVLGLVCLTSQEAPKSDRISYRTTTKKSLDALHFTAQRAKLLEIYRDNTRMLSKAVRYCETNKIGMYRMSSSMFPFADDLRFADLLDDVAPQLLNIGNYALQHNVRLLSHPDQFCVLSSDKMSVIENSIGMLRHEARVFDMMGLPQSNWSPINIHVGRKGDEARRTITNVIRDLPDNIRLRLTLENDEFKQNSAETYTVCKDAGVAFLFDWHHELVSAKSSGYDDDHLYDCAKLAGSTWSNPDWQVQHLSNGESGLHDRKHSDLITLRPSDLSVCPWLEVEAKGKERAIKMFPR